MSPAITPLFARGAIFLSGSPRFFAGGIINPGASPGGTEMKPPCRAALSRGAPYQSCNQIWTTTLQ